MLTEELEQKLASYTSQLRLEFKLPVEISTIFPSKKDVSDLKFQVNILVEQADYLLSHKTNFSVLNNEIGIMDRDDLIKMFIEDVEQFCTANNIRLISETLLRFSQSQIPDHTFYHLASSQLLPKAYEHIDMHNQREIFNLYSIPFKVRLAIENKLKSIIGYVSCDVTRHKKTRSNTQEFPVSMIFSELKKLQCLKLPVSIDDLSNIYSWSCKFCHTGEKEYLWMLMKSLNILSNLFIYHKVQHFEIEVDELWHKYVLSPDYLMDKFLEYRGVRKPLYYFREFWSVGKLQKKLNNTKNKNLAPYKFKLSELELGENYSFYCSKTQSQV